MAAAATGVMHWGVHVQIRGLAIADFGLGLSVFGDVTIAGVTASCVTANAAALAELPGARRSHERSRLGSKILGLSWYAKHAQGLAGVDI